MKRDSPAMPSQALLGTCKGSALRGFNRWRDLLLDTMAVEQDLQLLGNRKKSPELFRSQASIKFIAGLPLFNSWTFHDSTMRIVHDKRHVSHMHTHVAFLNLQLEGITYIEKYAGQPCSELHPGDWMLGRTTDCYGTVYRPGKDGSIILGLPWRWASRLKDDFFGRRMSGDKLFNKLVAFYIRNLAEENSEMEHSTSCNIAHNLVDLIELALNENPDNPGCNEDRNYSTLTMLMHFLDANYSRFDLTPAQAAKHAGVSLRHLHRLLGQAGTTFSNQLYDRRLECAHRMLTDAKHHDRCITEIAYGCGFSDLTHFGRRFRAKYGMTPSEARTTDSYNNQLSGSLVHYRQQITGQD